MKKYPMIKMDGVDDPQRCQGGSTMQCQHKQVPGSKFCPKHGGAHTAKANEKEAIRMYKLLEWQNRAGEFANAKQTKTLKDEVGILRFTLEQLMCQCTDANQLLQKNHQIVMMTNSIGKLMEVTQKLEEKGKFLLDQGVIFNIADAIVELVKLHVTDSTILEKIAEGMSDVIEKTIYGEDSSKL